MRSTNNKVIKNKNNIKIWVRMTYLSTILVIITIIINVLLNCFVFVTQYTVATCAIYINANNNIMQGNIYSNSKKITYFFPFSYEDESGSGNIYIATWPQYLTQNNHQIKEKHKINYIYSHHPPSERYANVFLSKDKILGNELPSSKFVAAIPNEINLYFIEEYTNYYYLDERFGYDDFYDFYRPYKYFSLNYIPYMNDTNNDKKPIYDYNYRYGFFAIL